MAQWEQQQREQLIRNNPELVANLGEEIFSSKDPIVQRALSALIFENSDETTSTMHAGTQNDCITRSRQDLSYVDCTQIESDAENAGGMDSGIEPKEYRDLDEPHAQGGQKNQRKLQYDCQSSESISINVANDISYAGMDLGQRILLEFQRIGLYVELEDTSICSFQSDPAESEHEEITMGICKDELQHQVSKKKHHLQRVESATFKRRKIEDSECEALAITTLVESASSRSINQRELQFGCQTWDSVSSNAVNGILYEERIGLFQELQDTAISPEPAESEDEEIKTEICKDELQHQVSKNKHHLQKVGKAAFKRRKIEDRECEALVMNTLVESASNRAILPVQPVMPGPQVKPLERPQIQPQGQDGRDRHNATLQVQVGTLEVQLDALQLGTNNIITTEVSSTMWS